MFKASFLLFLFLIIPRLIFAEAPPVVLEDGKEYYEIGLNLDILEDPTGKLTIDDVNSPEWAVKFKRSQDKVPNFGFSKSSFWAKLKIKKLVKNKKWYLSFNYFTQDKVTFYKKIGNKWSKITTGDIYPFKTREIDSRSFVFNLEPKGDSLYFIRIEGSISQLNLSILSSEKMISQKTEENFSYGLFFGLVISMILYNFFIFSVTKNKAYLFYIFYVLSHGLFLASYLGFNQRFLFKDFTWISNNGVIFLAGLTELSLCLFTIYFLNLKENSSKLYKLILIFYITSFLIILSSFFLDYSFNLKLFIINGIIIMPILFYSAIHQLIRSYRPAKFFIIAFSFLFVGTFVAALNIFGFLPSIFIVRQAAIFGNALELILLSMGLADRFNYQQEEALKKEKSLTLSLDDKNKKIEDLNTKLKGKIEDQSNQIKGLLDNMDSAVFAIGSNFKVLPPVSKYSETLFGIDIIGKKVSDFLFSNIKKGTKEYRDLLTVFSIIFSGDEIQYFGVSDNLPKKVTLPDENQDRGKTLKLSYSPFFNKDKLLEKLICIVEDITDSEEYLKKAEEDQVNFNFMNEILDTENKEELSKTLEFSLSELFNLLEDFTSPLSDTYLPDYFHDKLKNHFGVLYEKYKHLKELDNRIMNHISKIEYFESLLLKPQNKNQQLLNPQVEAASIVCDMIETFLQYIKVFERFIPLNLSLNRDFEKIILEKVKDIDKVFKNLFEYIFLVREVDQISDKQFQKAIQVAKLYPDFDRTMDLIQQRSRLLSFLCLGAGEEEISKSYNNLSYLVRQMPERSKLSEFMIKKNLIEPYKEVVETTKNIEEELPERIEERQKEILSDFDYLKLLNELLKRFLKEKEEGPDQKLPPLPEIEPLNHVHFEPFINTIEISLNNFEKRSEHSIGDHKERNQKSLNSNISATEALITRVLSKDLKEKNALPVSKTNRKFVSFLKAWTSGKDKETQ